MSLEDRKRKRDNEEFDVDDITKKALILSLSDDEEQEEVKICNGSLSTAIFVLDQVQLFKSVIPTGYKMCYTFYYSGLGIVLQNNMEKLNRTNIMISTNQTSGFLPIYFSFSKLKV